MKLNQWQNIVHVIINANSILKYAIQIKNGITKHVNVNAKIIVSAKKIIVGILTTFICENSKYLKRIPATSMADCDEIITVMDTISTKKTNTIATNVTSTALINFNGKKVRDCYILSTVLLAVILLLIIIICYYYVKQKVTI